MCHTRVFGLGILNYAYWVFKDAIFTPRSNYYTCVFLSRILTNWSVGALEILANDIFLSFGAFSSAYRCATLAFSVLEF